MYLSNIVMLYLAADSNNNCFLVLIKSILPGQASTIEDCFMPQVIRYLLQYLKSVSMAAARVDLQHTELGGGIGERGEGERGRGRERMEYIMDRTPNVPSGGEFGGFVISTCIVS